MSFRGRGTGRGASRGASRGGRGGGRGGFNSFSGPPDSVVEMGLFLHPCEGEMVCSRSQNQTKIPYFNAPIFLENKTQIGKVDEILGPMTELFFTVKLDAGVVADSFKRNDKVYIAPDKLLPLERFLPKPAAPGGKGSLTINLVAKPLGRQGMVQKKPQRGGFVGRGAPRGRGGARGARGGTRGARGAPRGGRGRGR